LAIVVVILGLLLALQFLHEIDPRTAIALTGGSLVAVVGYLDDRFSVAPQWRLAIHSVAAVWFLVWVGPIAALPIAGCDCELGWAGIVLAFFWVIWLLNLYNFMDGIDGIAGVEAVTVCVAAATIVAYSGDVEMAGLLAGVGASAIGFLFWNWPPARIFMGDVGGGFLGFLFAGLSLITHNQGTMTIWSWLIILGVFVVDSSVTLIRRLAAREKIHQAHRNHAYQHASRLAGAHLPVSVAIGLINLLWLLPISFLATLWPDYGAALVILAWLPLAGLALRFRAGIPD